MVRKNLEGLEYLFGEQEMGHYAYLSIEQTLNFIVVNISTDKARKARKVFLSPAQSPLSHFFVRSSMPLLIRLFVSLRSEFQTMFFPEAQT